MRVDDHMQPIDPATGNTVAVGRQETAVAFVVTNHVGMASEDVRWFLADVDDVDAALHEARLYTEWLDGPWVLQKARLNMTVEALVTLDEG